MQEPVVASLSPETLGGMLYELEFHTTWTADEIAIVRNLFAKGLIHTLHCVDFTNFLYQTGGEALVLKYASDTLVSKNMHFVIATSKKEENKEADLEQLMDQAHKLYHAKQYEQAVMLYLEVQSMNNLDENLRTQYFTQLIDCFIKLGRYEDAWRECSLPLYYCRFEMQSKIENSLPMLLQYPTYVVPPAGILHHGFKVTQYLIDESMIDNRDFCNRTCFMEMFPHVICVRADKGIVVWNCHQNQRQLLIKGSCATCFGGQLYAFIGNNPNYGVATYALQENAMQQKAPASISTPVKLLGHDAKMPSSLYVDDNWIFTPTCFLGVVATNRKSGEECFLYTQSWAGDIIVASYLGNPAVFVACEDSVVRIYPLNWKPNTTHLLHTSTLHDRVVPMHSASMHMNTLGNSRLLCSSTEAILESNKEYFELRVWHIDERKIEHCIRFTAAISAMSIYESSGTVCVGHANGTVSLLIGFPASGAINPVHVCTIQASKHRIDSVRLLKEDELLVGSMRSRTISHFILQVPSETQKRACNFCKKWSAQNMRCSRCKSVHYCNSTCQTTDWPNHKATCTKE